MLAERQVPRERRQYTPADQARALVVVLREEFGVEFRFHDAANGSPIPCEEEQGLQPVLSVDQIARITAAGRAEVTAKGGLLQVVLPLSQSGRIVLVAVGEVLAYAPGSEPERLRVQKWAQTFAERLRLTDEFFAQRGATPEVAPPSAPAVPSTPAWEALLTLDHLMRRTRVHKEPAQTARRILEGVFALLPARSLAWVPGLPHEAPMVHGEPCLTPGDWHELAAQLTRTAGESTDPIFCNDIPRTWGDGFPGIQTLLALPVTQAGGMGWVIAVNKRAGPGQPAVPSPFRKSDAALMMPFVALLDLHGRASRRYLELKELLVGLTRSLTAALDAKDSYTFGHSERVARIGVELGRDLGLSADDLSDIYLAGLLHDVGKIGIRDSVLTKAGPLTREEFEHIKQHVTIGYNILSELHPIRNLLPGVLWHHERWDGTGYPHGLAGEAIPLLARILAVADAYDAMSTVRPYRQAMPRQRVEQVLNEGAGTQWDARIIAAFERCRQKIHAIRERGVGESLCAAIDGALRSDTPENLLASAAKPQVLGDSR